MTRYFDANATTRLRPEARTAWLEASDEFWHNPSSPSRASARAHAKLEQARAELAELFSVEPESVVFNSGATEGNRDVMDYFHRLHPGRRIAVSSVEHPAVLENARAVWGGKLHVFPVDDQGRADLNALAEQLNEEFFLVSLMAANNENGVLQPWRECLELCRNKRASVHIDATQWIGKEPLDGLNAADFVTGSGHKFGGPKGVGFLIFSAHHSGFCGQRGGPQENDHRAGTENLPSILSMVAALKAQEAERPAVVKQWRTARDQLETKLINAISGLKVWGAEAPRLANTSSICLPEGESSRWMRKLDQKGFIVSTGSACATGKEGPSHVLAAMGASADEAHRTIRISAPWDATSEDWDALADTLIELWLSHDDQGGDSQVIQL